MRIRRALLFMPGDDRAKIEKGAGLDVDSIIMDLEDGVALNRKAPARETVLKALKEVPFNDIECLVRINPVTYLHSMWQHDLETTLPGRPDGYVIPKVENAEQIHRVAEIITQFEKQQRWTEGEIRLLAIIESAKGVVNLNAIASSSDRLDGLIFGAEDLAGDIGAMRTPDGWEVFYARSAVVIHAAAYRLQAIDTPFVDLTVEDSQLLTETEQAHYMGYTGKLAIHPKQVPVIQSVFTPTHAQIERAQALITAHNAHQAEGTGVFVHEGKMVDMPMIRAAETVIARAHAAGVIE